MERQSNGDIYDRLGVTEGHQRTGTGEQDRRVLDA